MVVNENFSSTKKLVCSKWCYRQAFFMKNQKNLDVIFAIVWKTRCIASRCTAFCKSSPLANDLTNTRLYTDVCSIIEQGRKEAYASVNHKMIETYWNIGRRIVEEEQNGEARAEYGAQIIAQLSEQLTHQYGKGFSKRNLAYFRQFYLTINDIRILQSRLQNLAWTHIINPTIGIVLCSETSKDIARYSILKDSDHLFATKYKTYLPTEEQLRTEIERQKQLFYLQHGSK